MEWLNASAPTWLVLACFVLLIVAIYTIDGKLNRIIDEFFVYIKKPQQDNAKKWNINGPESFDSDVA